jgi:hypothetical protein
LINEDYILKREFGIKDFEHLKELRDSEQVKELRVLLAGEFEIEPILYYATHFRKSLLSLVTDQVVGEIAIRVLSFIGYPEDIRFMINNSPQTQKFNNIWAYYIVSALTDPKTTEEWTFLRNCAENKYNDLLVDVGAITSLKLLATPQSLSVLNEVRKINTKREKIIERAISYINNKPLPLSGEELTEMSNRVAEAIKIGKWKGNEKPRYNKEKDIAIIDSKFSTGDDSLIYTSTFHKVGNMWIFRGVRETYQALMK